MFELVRGQEEMMIRTFGPTYQTHLEEYIKHPLT